MPISIPNNERRINMISYDQPPGYQGPDSTQVPAAQQQRGAVVTEAVLDQGVTTPANPDQSVVAQQWGRPEVGVNPQPDLEILNATYPIARIGSSEWRQDMLKLPVVYWRQMFDTVCRQLGIDAMLLADFVKKCVERVKWVDVYHAKGENQMLNAFVEAGLMFPDPDGEKGIFRPTEKMCQVVSAAVKQFEDEGGQLRIAK